MISKVKAARLAVFAGVAVTIADGRSQRVIKRVFAGESVGTRFIACADEDLNEQKRWLMAAKGFGQIIIDAGAAKALRSGKSLLFPGVTAVKGLFEAGGIVEVASDGEIVSYGKSNFSEKALRQALEKKNKNTEAQIPIDREVIHCDYMVVIKNSRS